jgi:prepilin-type N-terminal cleavage/methylation domain-containing protein
MRNERGFTLIELMIVIAIIAIIAAIAIPNLIEARKGANEASAIGALRTVASAQALYQSGGKEVTGSPQTPIYASTMAKLSTQGLVDNVLGGGTKSGYSFSMLGGDSNSWSCQATPSSGNSGTRSFYVDQTGVILFTNSGVAAPGSPALGQ